MAYVITLEDAARTNDESLSTSSKAKSGQIDATPGTFENVNLHKVASKANLEAPQSKTKKKQRSISSIIKGWWKKSKKNSKVSSASSCSPSLEDTLKERRYSDQEENENEVDQKKESSEEPKKEKSTEAELRRQPSNKLRRNVIDVDGKKYTLRNVMGAGTYGYVFSAWDEQGKKVAVKFFKKDDENARKEAEMYRIASDSGTSYLPKLLHTTVHEGKFCMICEREGQNLGQLMCRKPSRQFYPQTIAMLGYELMNAFEDFHNAGLVHRDIHLGNVLAGHRDETKVFLCDLGFTQRWRKEDGEHVPREEYQVAVGTSRFSSINNHKHLTYSRRDDLESIGYLLIMALTGDLPWTPLQRVKDRRQKWGMIMKMKLEFEESAFFQRLPIEIQQYISYAKSLKFDEKPDYDKMRGFFHALLKKEEKKYGKRYFDWMYCWEE